MSRSLPDELTQLRGFILDPDALVRAVASGRRRGQEPPSWPASGSAPKQGRPLELRRVELRMVDLKSGPHLQLTAYDATAAHTTNYPAGSPEAATVVDELLALPFGNWHLDTVEQTRQLRVTKKGDALVSVAAREGGPQVERAHDRTKQRLIGAQDPMLRALGITDGEGRVRAGRADKYRQVEEFARQLKATLEDAFSAGSLRTPTEAEPLRVVDLGAGNAYLTFVAHRLLVDGLGLPIELTGVDVKEQSRTHNAAVAAELGVRVDFVQASIEDYRPQQPPEVVLALHACDTATDDSLARAVGWGAPVVLAAPCCHHDIAAQLRRGVPPAPYGALVRSGILRERFADTLTDALRAALLRRQGYRVEVVEFVASEHTPRNTLLRAIRTGAAAEPAVVEEYDELVAAWGLRPRLGELLG